MSIFSKDQVTGLAMIPSIDTAAPSKLETATFALG
jgi:hypothetical protein